MRFRELGASPVIEGGAEGVREVARTLALVSFADIAVFFAVLLVGFAYVWRRGDLDWVRSTSNQRGEVVERTPPRALEVPQRSSGSVLST